MDFNVAAIFDLVADAAPDREAIVFRDRRLSYREVRERARRLGTLLRARGVTIRAERDASTPRWVSTQEHVGLYLHNGNEYLEGILGAFHARAVPFNVNYRYTGPELLYLLSDAAPAAIIFHACFAERLALLLPDLPRTTVLLQVADESGAELLPGAVDYEAALAGSSADVSDDLSPDDLYMLYTGGTTGMPKGVLWRQADALPGCFGGRDDAGQPIVTVEGLVHRVQEQTLRIVPCPPFMHGAGHWGALNALTSGGAVLVPPIVDRFDAANVWRLVESERATRLVIVGAAFARPLLDELERGAYDTSSVETIITGGSLVTAELKSEMLEALPHVVIHDAAGSSESGTQITQTSAVGFGTPGVFRPRLSTVVLEEDLSGIIPVGDVRVGWLASCGHIPLGYLGSPEKTADTFPEVNGTRYSVPGDRARYRVDGSIELLGRDSLMINSGGEKIFVEEVEGALASHPAVADVLVTSRPSERWGDEVVAIVQLRVGRATSEDGLREHAAARIARYKLPKQIVFVDSVARTPTGKADYRWARDVATASFEERGA